MNILIPARNGSSRIKSKPLTRILGQPLIKWMAGKALEIKDSQVIVCSDHQDIKNSLKGMKVTNTDIIKTYRNGTECALDNIQKKNQPFVVLDCGEIGILPKSIEKLIEMVSSGSCDIATCVQKITATDMADINVVKTVLSSNDEVIYLSRAPVPFPKNIETTVFWKHIGVCCYSSKAVDSFMSAGICDAEKLEGIDLIRALNCRLRIKVLKINYEALSLKTPEDIIKAERHLSIERARVGKPITIPRI